jgi:hypothetical protein
MPINKKWKVGLVSGFTILAIALLLVPYKATTYNPGFEPNDLSQKSMDENQRTYLDYNLPWRSYNQQFGIYVNASEGKFTVEILNSNNFWKKEFDQDYEALFKISNITFFENSVIIDPPQEGLIFITITAEAYTVISYNSMLTYYSYYSNYGFFFLAISLLLTSFYVYQKVKGAF